MDLASPEGLRLFGTRAITARPYLPVNVWTLQSLCPHMEIHLKYFKGGWKELEFTTLNRDNEIDD